MDDFYRSKQPKKLTERPQLKAIRKSKSEKLVCRYCGSDDLAPQLHQATRSPMPQMFQQALGVGGADQEDEGLEVDLL